MFEMDELKQPGLAGQSREQMERRDRALRQGHEIETDAVWNGVPQRVRVSAYCN